MKKINIRSAADKALNIMYPRVCPVCGHLLPGNPEKENFLNKNPFICDKCYPYLKFPHAPRCLKCSRPILDESEPYCRECRKDVKYFDNGVSLLMHEGAAKKIIYDLKFFNKRDNADMLALEAAKRFYDVIRTWDPDVMVPVPLYRKKELSRGFNQALLLAEKFSKYMEIMGVNIPVDKNMLIRCRSTLPMKELPAMQRKQNISGAFKAEKPSAYKKILLVDDIFTTGATLSECARVLKAAGAQKVYFLAFSM